MVMQEKANNKNNKNRSVVNTPFLCTTPVQIRYTDYDMQGHINNSIYFNFFDTAKMDYFKKVRGNNMHWEDVTVVIANMNIDFYSPTRYFENVAVETQTTRLGDKSLTLVHRLVNTDDHQVKCVCSTVMVYLDPKTQQPATIPQYWRQAIRDYEGHDL